MLTDEIIWFLRHQNFTIVTTIDENGLPHNSCKGMVDIDKGGLIYLLDLYRGKTFKNLKRNPNVSITGVDEHKFAGYCLKGEAEIIEREGFSPHLIEAWEKKIAGRITQRILKEMRGEKGHHHQAEALLPKPAYLIAVKIREVIDLTPRHIKGGEEYEAKGE